MSKTVNFALRLPPEMKEAAKSLTETHFNQWERDSDGFERTVAPSSPSSINEAINYLMWHGLKPTLAIVQRELDDARKEYDAYQAIMSVLMANPTADAASLDLYEAGSTAREVIEGWTADDPEELGGSYHDADIRKEAAFQFSIGQQRVMALGAAVAALQKALEQPAKERAARDEELKRKAEAMEMRRDVVVDLLKNSLAPGGKE